MNAPRDPYADVGAAIRQAIDRAIASNLAGRDFRVLLAIISLVSSYSRLEEEGHSVDEIAAKAALDRRHAQRCLRRLESAGAIIFRPGCGYGHRSTVGLPRDEERAAAGGALSIARGWPKRAGKGGRNEPKRTAAGGAHTELPSIRGGGAGSPEPAAPPLVDETCIRCGASPARDFDEGVLCDRCAGGRAWH